MTHDLAQEPTTKRLHERMRNHWASVKEMRPFPREDELDPAAIPDIWPHCFLIDIRSGRVKNGFRYEYMGEPLMLAYGANMMAFERCDATTEPHIHSLLTTLDQVVESGEEAVDENEFTNVQGLLVKYRSCLLPLGRDKVEYVLGCMRWKEG